MKEKVYVAMAGQHQIWEYNVLDGVTKVFSGNGYERNLNGSTYVYTFSRLNYLTPCLLPFNGIIFRCCSPQTISFAQPSGISLGPGNDNKLFTLNCFKANKE